MKDKGESCVCIHDNPFISSFTAMFKSNELSKEVMQSQFNDNTIQNVHINIPEIDE